MQTWKPGVSYVKGNIVIAGNDLWVANKPNVNSPPVNGSVDWTVVVGNNDAAQAVAWLTENFNYFADDKLAIGAVDYAVNGSDTADYQADVVRKAGKQLFQAWDGSPQFTIGGLEGAQNYLFTEGALNNFGPVLTAEGLDTNIDVNVAGKGTGGVYFYNGTGYILSLVDDGTGLGMSNYLSISGAASTADPKISSNRGVIVNAASGQELNVTAGGHTMFKSRRLSGTTTDRYWTLSGGTDYARITVEGTATNASGYFAAKGTGGHFFASTGGTLVTMDTNGQNAGIVNGIMLRGTLTGSHPVIRALGETNIGLTIGPMSGGTGSLRLEVPNVINRFLVTGVTFNTPVTGFSITISDTVAELHLTPAGTLTTGTIVMPAAPYDGQTVTVSTTETVTGLTVSPNSGQTVSGVPTTITAQTPFAMRYRTSTTQWRRVI